MALQPIMKKLKQPCRLLLQNLYWELRGRGLRNPPLPANAVSFLFICKGNICRSPAAGLLAKNILGTGQPARLLFTSAGLEANESERSPAEAVQAGWSLGIQLQDHQPVRVSKKMLEGADMVFAMEVRQLKELRRRFPAHRRQFFLLPLFGGHRAWGYARYNIRDPYGKPIAEFSRCFQNIMECLDNLKTALTGLHIAEERFRTEKESDLPQKVSNW